MDNGPGLGRVENGLPPLAASLALPGDNDHYQLPVLYHLSDLVVRPEITEPGFLQPAGSRDLWKRSGLQCPAQRAHLYHPDHLDLLVPMAAQTQTALDRYRRPGAALHPVHQAALPSGSAGSRVIGGDDVFPLWLFAEEEGENTGVKRRRTGTGRKDWGRGLGAKIPA